MPTCCYVLSSGKPCGNSVSYTMSEDEETNSRYRKYNPWCNQHLAVVKAQEENKRKYLEKYPTVSSYKEYLDVFTEEDGLPKLTEIEFESVFLDY